MNEDESKKCDLIWREIMVDDVLVSVVITTYNGTASIERAVDSVVLQTYKNIETIVVDDNGLGTDIQKKTEEIVKKYKNIIYIPHKYNVNGSAARNTGIYAAHGKYIAFLDDDDAFNEHKIEKQVIELEHCSEKYAICYTGMLVHFPDGHTESQVQNDKGNLFSKVMRREIHAPTSALMIRRDALIEQKGFDETFIRHQDWECLDRLSQKYFVTVVAETLMDRFIVKRNSASDARKYEKNRCYYLEKMQPLICSLDNEDKKYIYYFHYKSIAKEFLKEKKICGFIKYAIKTRNIMRLMNDLIRDIKRKNYYRG